MLGLISNGIIVGIVFMLIAILIQSGVVSYLTRLLAFKNTKYKTALLYAFILGIVSFVLTLVASFLNILPLIVELIGVVIYASVAYVLAQKFYKEERKPLLTFTGLVVLFAFVLNIVTVMLITLISSTIRIW